MKCFFCGAEKGLNLHHIFGGSRREKSELYGLLVPLCHVGCHQFGRDSIHDGYTEKAHERREALHKYGQRKAMSENGLTKEQFIEIFGKSYLSDDEIAELQLEDFPADTIESQQTVLRAQKAALEAKQDKAREKLFDYVTRKYRTAKGDARKAYRDVLDMICGSIMDEEGEE